MRTFQFFALSLALIGVISGCTLTPVQQTAYSPGFFYLALTPELSIVFSDAPGSPAQTQIKLNPPTDCSFYALRPAPIGRWIAVEWECTFGPAVELFDTANGQSHFALSDPTIDSRYLAWQPDGRSIFLKIGTLSVPQILRVDVENNKAVELNISPITYDLISSPDMTRVLFSLTRGIGFGSETWLAGPEGQNPSELLVDGNNITALTQYAPDGTQIAYIKFPDDQQSTPAGELWLMDSGGFRPRKLADADAGHGFAPAWSPDGNTIAFIGRVKTEGTDTPSLSIYNLAQDKLTVVPVAPSTQPIWSSDGSMIAFSANPTIMEGSDKMNIWLYEISSGQLRKLVPSACCAGWIH